MSSALPTRSAPGNLRGRRIIAAVASARAWIFLLLLLVVFEIWSQIAYGSTFIFSSFNIRSVAVFAVAPVLLGLGQTLVIISGGIDLSVGFTMGLAAVIAAHVANDVGAFAGAPIGLLAGVVVALAATLIPGWINGLLIARLRIPPFIGTLGMYGVARGAAYLFAGGTTVPVDNSWLTYLGNGRILGIPVIVIVTVIFVALVHYLLSETQFGQYTYAIGGNRQATLRAGVNVRRVTIILYMLSALTAGIDGILYTGRFAAGAPQAGEPLLLDSIAAVVIGGASLFGGSGTIIGTIIGALIIAVIQYGLVFLNVEPFWQFIAVGLVIIVSVLVDQSQRRFGGGRQDE
ncbi:ABC transporter permease [Acidisoma cellulosilytica]|uniref:ABC transporter permease n=1 Tax=Acidisoma cellulosilyticum TaxID=2802395 RepID=A0A964E577_9PROT|nr:ABC transporter permease [Acidisoma cellulosilyticum]MCB8882420.1 ABC transporter permease [Acidisoma cellulosilyticum]